MINVIKHLLKIKHPKYLGQVAPTLSCVIYQVYIDINLSGVHRY